MIKQEKLQDYKRNINELTFPMARRSDLHTCDSWVRGLDHAELY